MIYPFLQIFIKAITYRLRGMAHSNMTTQEARIVFWGFPYAIDGAFFAYALGYGRFDGTLIAIICLLFGWSAATIGHGNWESTGGKNYTIMGIVTTAMLFIMFSPLLVLDWHLVQFVPLGILGTFASWLGYNARLPDYAPLGLVQGDSSSEEVYIGALAFGVPIALAEYYVLGVL